MHIFVPLRHANRRWFSDMIQFILNQTLIETNKPPGLTLLDFVRYEAHLCGTKIGCREGDCGACTVLIGALHGGEMQYQSATSCLTPLANVHGRHVVTVEGLNLPGKRLNRAQEAMVQHSATQCGFCTPGFVVSLCGYALNVQKADAAGAVGAIDGNICRCTGYKSIERAAGDLALHLEKKDAAHALPWLVSERFLPDYFTGIPERLSQLNNKDRKLHSGHTPIGGGTDLYVQKHHEIPDMELQFMARQKPADAILFDENSCTLTAQATATDLMEAAPLSEAVPGWRQFLKLVSSTPIRNIGTVAGNIANASPIGDLSIMLLAVGARLTLVDESLSTEREIALDGLYLDYKKLDKTPAEIIRRIRFDIPRKGQFFNFEKVCKRQYLDIASVNTALLVTVENEKITTARCSIGGVAPIPKYLRETSRFLEGRSLSAETVRQALAVLQTEISPISDVRGTAEYKRLLAKQLFCAHFVELFPQTIKMEDLL
ncbi:MAG TPA: FAD binding domain-containing protein [Saprospiraceae bacterium]|nr:FAD binding domain-containing protein [Saprospiraceae bacterium]